MKPHQERVVAEKQELDDKIGRLDTFIGSPTYHSLDVAERLRLCAQLETMQLYSKILGERIAAFS